MQRVGLAIQIACVIAFFFFAYLGIIRHPAYFFAGFLPYMLGYNVIFRGYIAKDDKADS